MEIQDLSLFSPFFSPHPTLSLVVLHSFLGVPFMAVRLQVHSLFSLSTFFPDPFPLIFSVLPLPPPRCSTSAALAGKRVTRLFEAIIILNHAIIYVKQFDFKCLDTFVEMKYDSSHRTACRAYKLLTLCTYVELRFKHFTLPTCERAVIQ